MKPPLRASALSILELGVAKKVRRTRGSFFVRIASLVLLSFLVSNCISFFANSAGSLSSVVSLYGGIRRSREAAVEQSRRAKVNVNVNVIALGPPFSFKVKDHLSSWRHVVISHAIAVPSEHCVVFLAPRLGNIPASPDAVFPLPDDYVCSFDRLGGGPAVPTRLEIYRSAKRWFMSSTVWRCALPQQNIASHETVRLAGPSDSVAGYDVFWLGGAKVPRTSVVACTNLHSLVPGNVVHSRLLQYVAHYRALGIGHFVFYVAKDTLGMDILLQIPDVTIVHLGTTYNGKRKYGGQSVAATDCVWRTRDRADWNMILVDLDEYVAGTRDLRATLREKGNGFSTVNLKHRLVQLPFEQPLVHDGLKITTEVMPTMGKSFVRPDHVDVMWVHGATAFSPTSAEKEIRLTSVFLLHFQREHHHKYNTSDARKYSFETLGSSMLPET